MLDYAEIELGGKKRRGRLSWNAMKLLIEETGCDLIKILRRLVVFEHDPATGCMDRHVADFTGLELMLYAAWRWFEPELKRTEVAEIVAEVDRAEQERDNQALAHAAALIEADTAAKIAAATAEDGTIGSVAPPLNWLEAYRQVYREHPEVLQGVKIIDLADHVAECRRAGGVRAEQRPNDQRPAMH